MESRNPESKPSPTGPAIYCKGGHDPIDRENSVIVDGHCPICLLQENEALKKEVREWICVSCNMVYPGPPQPGFACVQCPGCGGDTMPRGMAKNEALRRKADRLIEALEMCHTILKGSVFNFAQGLGNRPPLMGEIEKTLTDFDALPKEGKSIDANDGKKEGQHENPK